MVINVTSDTKGFLHFCIGCITSLRANFLRFLRIEYALVYSQVLIGKWIYMVLGYLVEYARKISGKAIQAIHEVA
jgi:hypothetical protein